MTFPLQMVKLRLRETMCSEQIGEEAGGRKSDFLETIEISVTGERHAVRSKSKVPHHH